MSEPVPESFRWQAFFQHAAQPIFLLNRRRRILFVNRAWEACTGLKLAEVRGRACRRRAAHAMGEKEEAILAACAPPTDALEGQSCRERRRAPQGSGWWEIHFQPFAGEQELLGMLGTIRVLADPTEMPLPLPDRLTALRDRVAARHRLDDLITDTPALARLVEQARLAAQTRTPITLLGEPGSGKAWLARAIHLRSEAGQRPFACLDAARIPAPLLGETLLGPRSRQLPLGTVYLRNAERLSAEWQSRITDALRTGEHAELPRLMVGYRGDPAAEVSAGRLLPDFYCAVSPIVITLPPLRDRLGDLARFIDIFLQQLRELKPHSVRTVSNEAMAVLRAHRWPGNLAELQAVLSDSCVRAKSERLELADLPYYLKQTPAPPQRSLPLDALLEQVERRLIALALKLAQNNQTRAAELLQVWRPRLVRRLEKLGI